MKANGEFLRKKWKIPVALNRFHWKGSWWELPHTYPCSFSDVSGYVVFNNEEEIKSSEFFRIAPNSDKVSLPESSDKLSDIPGYIRVSKPIIEEVFIEEDLLPEKHGPDGYVYLITNEVWEGWVKIGSSFDPERRLKNYQTGDPHRKYRLRDKRQFPDRKGAEFAIHEMLKSEGFVSEGEWFEISISEAKSRLHGY
tara:strand:- start:134 stop:721 length:588 start_codon:yes stop_codon:yes gene_type:complete